MKLPLLLYNFSKTYIPAVIFLCVFYTLLYKASDITKAIYQPKGADKQSNQTITPPTQPKYNSKSSVIPITKPVPEKPRYYYLIEFTSGGSTKAKEIKVGNNMVKIIISDSYDMTMSKNDIKSIKKLRL